jgi:hypothetical protein
MRQTILVSNWVNKSRQGHAMMTDSAKTKPRGAPRGQFHIRMEEAECETLGRIRERLASEGEPQMNSFQDVVRYILRDYIRRERAAGRLKS